MGMYMPGHKVGDYRYCLHAIESSHFNIGSLFTNQDNITISPGCVCMHVHCVVCVYVCGYVHVCKLYNTLAI